MRYDSKRPGTPIDCPAFDDDTFQLCLVTLLALCRRIAFAWVILGRVAAVGCGILVFIVACLLRLLSRLLARLVTLRGLVVGLLVRHGFVLL